MARSKMTTTRRSDMTSSFEANAARWNEEAKQYAPVSDTSEKQPVPDDRIAALEKTIADLQGRLSQPQQVVVQTPPVPAQRQEARPAEVDYSNLPDPVADPAGYSKALGDRLLAKANADREYDARQAATVKNTQDARDALFEDFASRDEYKDIAEDEEGVEFAATKVLRRMQARKQDVNAYMFQRSEQFFADVAKEYNKTFHRDEDDETPTVVEEPNRTGGIPGGHESGSRPAARTAPVDGGLYTEVRAIQKKGGWY